MEALKPDPPVRLRPELAWLWRAGLETALLPAMCACAVASSQCISAVEREKRRMYADSGTQARLARLTYTFEATLDRPEQEQHGEVQAEAEDAVRRIELAKPPPALGEAVSVFSGNGSKGGISPRQPDQGFDFLAVESRSKGSDADEEQDAPPLHDADGFPLARAYDLAPGGEAVVL